MESREHETIAFIKTWEDSFHVVGGSAPPQTIFISSVLTCCLMLPWQVAALDRATVVTSENIKIQPAAYIISGKLIRIPILHGFMYFALSTKVVGSARDEYWERISSSNRNVMDLSGFDMDLVCIQYKVHLVTI